MPHTPSVDRHAIAAFRRFYSLLPRSEDASLVVLKLHLLVEEQIRAFVAERLVHPDALKAAKLTFHQASYLAQALSHEEIDSRIWDAAIKLNELRNDVAHQLDPPGAMQRMENICHQLGHHPQRRKGKKPEPLEDFSFAVSLIYNAISVHVKRQPAEVLTLVAPARE